MQPFNSNMSNHGHFTPSETSCERIAFDSEHLNVFAAEVVYCQPHWHDAPELIYVLSGGFEITVHQTKILACKGSLLYIGPDIIHSLEQTQPSSVLVTWQFSPRLFDLTHIAPKYYFMLGKSNSGFDELYNACSTHLDFIVQSTKRNLTHLAHIYNILAEIEKNVPPESMQFALVKSKDERTIRDSIDFINCHFHEPLSVSDLAEHANTSYFHFSRTFKKISGFTPSEYITMVRVNMAKSLLKNVSIPITEISQRVGFNEHRLMIAAFNKYCGETPSSYRKHFLADPNWFSASSDLHAFPNRPIRLKDVAKCPR